LAGKALAYSKKAQTTIKSGCGRKTLAYSKKTHLTILKVFVFRKTTAYQTKVQTKGVKKVFSHGVLFRGIQATENTFFRIVFSVQLLLAGKLIFFAEFLLFGNKKFRSHPIPNSSWNCFAEKSEKISFKFGIVLLEKNQF
jgi:hypothetical protein